MEIIPKEKIIKVFIFGEKTHIDLRGQIVKVQRKKRLKMKSRYLSQVNETFHQKSLNPRKHRENIYSYCPEIKSE